MSAEDMGEMMYFSDDEGDNFALSAAQWSKKEDSRMADKLQEVEDQLYSEKQESATTESGNFSHKDSEEIRAKHFLRRRCSAGYSAHSESVDEKETSVWKKRCTYLRVVGTKISIPSNLSLTISPEREESCSSLF